MTASIKNARATDPENQSHGRAPLRRTIWMLSILVAVAAALTVFFVGFHSIVEQDFWWHIKVGGDILSGSGIPQVDQYSYPSAGHPYVDLHWLFQVFLHTVHRIGGESGVVWVKCLIALAVFAIVYRLSRRSVSRPLAAMLVVFAAIIASERILARPEIGTYLLLATTSWLLRRHEEGARFAWMILPAIVVLWVNLEGLFILGPLLIGASLIDRLQDRRLWVALALGVLASLANPYFVTGAIHPFILFTRINGSLEIYSKTIGEFLGPFQPGFPHPAVAAFPYFLALIGIGFLLYARRPRIGDLILVAAFAYLAISARRNLPLLAIVATPIVARWIGDGLRVGWIGSLKNRLSLRARAAVATLALTVSLTSLVYYDLSLANGSIYNSIGTNRRFGTEPAPVAFPRTAVEFLRSNNVAGPIFNLLGAGGYLIYAFPEERVFIDGRLEVHSTEHYTRYLRMQAGGDAWMRAVQQFEFRCLILNYATATPLTLELLQDEAWEPVYLDDTVIVLVRSDSENESLIRSNRITRNSLIEKYPSIEDYDLSRLRGPDGVPPKRGLFERNLFPWSQLYLGQFFGVLMLPDLAGYQYAEAVETMPRNVTLRFLLADALIRGGRLASAKSILDETSRLHLSPSERASLSGKMQRIAAGVEERTTSQ